MPGELTRDAGLSVEEEINRVMIHILDRLQQEITTRFTRLKSLNTKFGFLLSVNTLFKVENAENIRQNCNELASFYDTDIDRKELFSEICDCKMRLNTHFRFCSRNCSGHSTACDLIR